MPFTFTMPKLSPTMESGTIAKWHKQEGDQVEVGDVLLEIATDKATVEHEAIDEGYLKKILVREGDEASVNQPVAILTESEDESIEGYEPEGEKAPSKEQEAPEEEKEEEKEKKETGKKEKPEPAKGLSQPQFVPEDPMKEVDFKQEERVSSKRVKASPLAKKLAADRGIDLAALSGSGPGGRIMKRDLQDQAPSRGDRPEVPSGTYEEVSLSQMRKVIASRLQEAKTFIPHFYVTQTVDAEAVAALRLQLINLGRKVSVNDCVIKACTLALRDHPEVNSGLNTVNQTIIRFKTIDISIAVSLPEGLITPIIRYADYKSLAQIGRESRELAKKAREGKLEMKEFKGGSFTVSNLGMYGVTHFQAIINPPQSCVLAVGGIIDEPVVKGGKVVPGKVMRITLSADHRVVDGVLAAEFVNTVKKYLENPAALIM